jgi:hypothetical protein
MLEEYCTAAAGAQGATLDELAHRIRSALQISRQDRCNALHRDLDAGDALIEAQRRISTGWKKWLGKNCFISVRTAMLYMRLARHREEIEAEIERAGELSLRAAIRLIATPTAPKPAKKPVPDLLTAWRATPDAEKTRALARIPVDDFYSVMPTSWRSDIEGRVIKLRAGVGAEPLIKVTEILRRALSLMKIATKTPGITPAVAAANEKEAITALRQLGVVLASAGVDLNEIAIMHSTVKARRRAA